MLTQNLPDSLASRILQIQDLAALREFGDEWVSNGEVTAFEVRVWRDHPDHPELLTHVGEGLPPWRNVEVEGVCAEGDGTWAFPLGEDDSTGLLRVRFATAPDAEQVARFQALGRALRMNVRHLIDQERLHELERSVAVLREQARQAEQLKEEFLSNLSHELRTPLTAMLGFAEILVERPELGEDHRVCVGRIRDNGERLLALLNRLIHLAKLQADRTNVFIAPTRLHVLIEEAVARLAHQAEAKSLRIEHRAESAEFDTDPRLMAQVLDCVLENAVKFTDYGGIVVRAGVEGDEVRIDIEDTGRGIDARSLPFVFDAFWQGDGSMTRAVGGNGIGLALASRLVNRLGGTIELDNRRSRGTLVCISLPRVAEHSASPRPSSRKPAAQQFGLPF